MQMPGLCYSSALRSHNQCERLYIVSRPIPCLRWVQPSSVCTCRVSRCWQQDEKTGLGVSISDLLNVSSEFTPRKITSLALRADEDLAQVIPPPGCSSILKPTGDGGKQPPASQLRDAALSCGMRHCCSLAQGGCLRGMPRDTEQVGGASLQQPAPSPSFLLSSGQLASLPGLLSCKPTASWW